MKKLQPDEDPNPPETREAEGIFPESCPISIGSFDDQIAAMDAAFAHAKANKVPIDAESKLEFAECFAQEILNSHGLPSDLIRRFGEPKIERIGVHRLVDRMCNLPGDLYDLVTKASDASQEAKTAIDLLGDILELRAALAETPSLHEVIYTAMLFGEKCYALELNLTHGPTVDGKRRRMRAIQDRSYTPDERARIKDAYEGCRAEHRTNAQAYRAVVRQLSDLELTEHAVRHVIKPRRGRAKEQS